jgi:WD40 repeat protein
MNRKCCFPIIGAVLLVFTLVVPARAQDMNRQAGKFSLDGPCTTVAMASKYEYMSFGMKAGGLSIYVVKRDKPVFANYWKAHDKAVTCIVFSPDNKLVASGGLDGQIKIWDTVKSAECALTAEAAKKAAPLHKIRAHTGGVFGLAFSPDGKRLASAGADGAVRFWNSATGEQLFAFTGAHKGGARAVAFSPDGQSLASAGMDKAVKVWEGKANGKTIRTLNMPAPVYSVAISADGQRIASGCGAPDQPGHVVLSNWDDGKEVTDFKGHSDIVNVVAFHPTEERLVSCSKDTTIRVWDLEKKEELYMDKHRDPVTGLSFCGDGQMFATASAEIIFLWQGTPKK